MRFIPKYRVSYQGNFYEAGQVFDIDAKDEAEMKRHGTVLDDPTPPAAETRRAGRPRRVEHGQSGEAETKNRRA